jgi:hypothetical protein
MGKLLVSPCFTYPPAEPVCATAHSWHCYLQHFEEFAGHTVKVWCPSCGGPTLSSSPSTTDNDTQSLCTKELMLPPSLSVCLQLPTRPSCLLIAFPCHPAAFNRTSSYYHWMNPGTLSSNACQYMIPVS